MRYSKESFFQERAPSIRYYFFDKSKWAFFGAFDFRYTQLKESTERFSNGPVMPEKTTTLITNYTPSVGANYAFASDIALEIKLFSDHTFYNTNNRPLNFNYSGLNLTFQNFLTIPQKGKTANQPPPQYLRKNKWLVDGGIYIARAGLITQKSNKISGTLNPTIGYFLNKNIVLGINARYSNSISQIKSGEAGRWNLEPFARFYQRLLPRFYLFGESRLLFFNYSSITNGVEKQKIANEWAFNLGYNYFLSQHIALEGLFYHFNYSKTATLIGTTREHEFGLKAKVRYFLN